jgi:CRISP-associated protein Cas1
MTKAKYIRNPFWQHLIRGKTLNQLKVLKKRQLNSAHLELALRQDTYDEGNCARRYWQLYFPSIGWVSSSRDRKQDNAPNKMLNYGYAVLGALCHRGLLIHGLSPLLGVKHVARFHSNPLVYDMMEPYRPAVDLMMADFMVGEDISMKAWCKKVGTELREQRV